MAKIIKQREYVEVTKYCLEFFWTEHGQPGWGFSFDCDSEGNILWDEMNPAAEDNLNKCLTGEHEVTFDGISERDQSYWTNTIIECENCGKEVELYDSWASVCDHCETEYNGSGQRLAPRSQWGGEFVSQPEEDYGLYEFNIDEL